MRTESSLVARLVADLNSCRSSRRRNLVRRVRPVHRRLPDAPRVLTLARALSSRFDGKFEKTFESTTAGVSIQTPQLDINTVAAGGGSCLTFRNGLFQAGPESAGAHPGPACYLKGGPLTVSDVNLVLGRLFPAYFPKIFGKSEDQPLGYEASVKAVEQVRKEINNYNLHHPSGSGKEMSLDEVAAGFVKVANEVMARPVRALTEARGFSTSKHILAAFGGAGGQHGASSCSRSPSQEALDD